MVFMVKGVINISINSIDVDLYTK